jgi:translation initiation factor IF-2
MYIYMYACIYIYMNIYIYVYMFIGEAIVVEVSAKNGEGVDDLVESLLLQADVLELRAANTGQAEATVLDACMDRGRGVIADVLVQWGNLSVGDPIVIGTSFGSVKAMTDDKGNRIMTAGPSTPVRYMWSFLFNTSMYN